MVPYQFIAGRAVVLLEIRSVGGRLAAIGAVMIAKLYIWSTKQQDRPQSARTFAMTPMVHCLYPRAHTADLEAYASHDIRLEGRAHAEHDGLPSAFPVDSPANTLVNTKRKPAGAPTVEGRLYDLQRAKYSLKFLS